MAEDARPSAVPRIVRDFAMVGGISTGTLGLLVTLIGAVIDLETVPGLTLASCVFVVLGLLAGSFAGLLLGLARQAWPGSLALWPLGFAVGGLIAVPIALFAGPDPADILETLVITSAMIGPPLGIAWATWLLIDGLGRDPRPFLAVLSFGIGPSLILLIGGLTLLRDLDLSGRPPAPPGPTSIVPPTGRP